MRALLLQRDLGLWVVRKEEQWLGSGWCVQQLQGVCYMLRQRDLGLWVVRNEEQWLGSGWCVQQLQGVRTLLLQRDLGLWVVGKEEQWLGSGWCGVSSSCRVCVACSCRELLDCEYYKLHFFLHELIAFYEQASSSTS
jgi:hypothetical protein